MNQAESVHSVQSASIEDPKQLSVEESIPEDIESKPTKCPNLTFNCIYQIIDILVALSLLYWAYCLSPKHFNTTFTNINETSFSMFISRSIITLYFFIFSIIIILYTFYYPFQIKSIYFNFYGRGIFFLFLGNITLLISSITNDNILSIYPTTDQIYKYGYYTSHYIICIGILYLLLSIITNPKFGTKYCFLPSPFIQLKNGQKLKFKTHSNYTEIKEELQPPEKQLSITVELASNTNKKSQKKSNNIKDNAWIKNDKKTNNNTSDSMTKLEVNKTLKNKNKRKSLNDIKKTKIKTVTQNKVSNEFDRRKSEIIVSKNEKVNSYSTESFQNRLSIFKNNATGISNEKIDKLKNERKEHDKDMKQDVETKRRATIALQTYANQAAAHSQDINLLNKNLKNITKNNCIEKLTEMGLLFGIYVPINEYQRWDIRSKLDKIIHSENIGENGRNNLNNTKQSNTKEYMKMYVFNLRNNALLTKISADQKDEFYKLISLNIETVPNIYMMDFTRSNANKMFLNIIFQSLIKRLNKKLYGPQEIFLESNGISDNACIEIINYISQNPSDLRVLRLSNSFNTIGTQTVVSFCDVMEHNKNIIKFSLDINYIMYTNRMDGYIRRNGNLWRDNKKMNAKNMIKRKSYDFLIKKSKHKARRSSVPNLHKAHPSLALIKGGFSTDKKEKNNKNKNKKNKKDNKHHKRRSSVPDAAKILHMNKSIPVVVPVQSRNRYNFSLKVSKENKRRSSMPPKPNKNIIKNKNNINVNVKRKSVINKSSVKNIEKIEKKVEEDSDSSSSDDDLNDLMSGNIFKNLNQNDD